MWKKRSSISCFTLEIAVDSTKPGVSGIFQVAGTQVLKSSYAGFPRTVAGIWIGTGVVITQASKPYFLPVMLPYWSYSSISHSFSKAWLNISETISFKFNHLLYSSTCSGKHRILLIWNRHQTLLWAIKKTRDRILRNNLISLLSIYHTLPKEVYFEISRHNK